ncbi:MarR family winged helix-turn-helix transcriptional regulator [Agrobacterium tumefaciens]|uniref:MarR family winged helix-turn-helix transcriptional regulator n=1 Tax=Rhizobium/Agrobacterium group TaxID=227290 RepID=UPI0008766842|nr:MarR family winged helix-turn-helix transcriptional regulator [Rhizobium sp. NFACC06-2]SCX99362.1 transcriptional regulator, MarR family [Rhizobium sp. NFACC06-2]
MDQLPRRTTDVNLDRLETALGFLIRLAQLKTYDDFFTALGDSGMRPGEFSVLFVIMHNPGIRQTALGQRLMIKRAHMTKLIRAFEDRGLVTRRVPDDDRRAIELTLSAEGVAHVRKESEWFFSHEATLGAGLTTVERDQFIALLHKFLGMNLGETGREY